MKFLQRMSRCVICFLTARFVGSGVHAAQVRTVLMGVD